MTIALEVSVGAINAMLIQRMSEAQCRRALEKARVGRLACARDNQPYVVPTYFAFDGTSLYGFSTLGQKIAWMRANPLVCLEIDERISHNQWMSVVVMGHYEELPDKPLNKAARAHAHAMLQQHPMWWEPGAIPAAHCNNPDSFVPVFYRIRIDEMTGLQATPDPGNPITPTEPRPRNRRHW